MSGPLLCNMELELNIRCQSWTVYTADVDQVADVT